jgi:hypothetical protein
MIFMEKEKIYLASIAVVAGGLLLGLALNDEEDKEFEEIEFNNSSGEVKTTSSGTKYIVNPDKLVAGCPGMDCIPSIDNPSFTGADEADWLESGDRVIGVEIGGEAKAYPLRILTAHEIVNDEIGGEPVAVTYCPLCRSGVTYSREVGNRTLEFGVSGKLRNANLIMYDRKTETYWSQIKGKAIIGPLVPKELELEFSSITEWGDWKEGHPDTKLLSRDTGIYPASTYTGGQYGGYAKSNSVGFGVDNVDDRLHSKKLVYGIEVGGEAKAYTEDAIRQEKMIEDTLGNRSVVIFESPDDGTIKAFISEDGGAELNLSLREKGLQDAKGDLWSFEGEKVNGDGELEGLTPKGFYWFAWSKFNPETQLYKLENQD